MLAVQQEHSVDSASSLKIATSTFATPTSFAARLHMNTARCNTRWKPNVGLHFAFLAFLEPGRGLVDVLFQLLLQLAQIGAARARISRHFGVSRDRSSRCSTVQGT